MRLGERVLNLLNERNIQQKELAKSFGIGTSTVSCWNQINRNPSAEMIIPICKFLQITPNELFEFSDPPSADDADLTCLSAPATACADEDEQFLLSAYHALDAGGKRVLLGLAETERRRVLSEGDNAQTTA